MKKSQTCNFNKKSPLSSLNFYKKYNWRFFDNINPTWEGWIKLNSTCETRNGSRFFAPFPRYTPVSCYLRNFQQMNYIELKKCM